MTVIADIVFFVINTFVKNKNRRCYPHVPQQDSSK